MVTGLSDWQKDVENEAAVLASSFFRSEDGPPSLYHYTSGEGLIGILQTRSLWASQATMLNDTREVQHGMDTAQRLITDRLHIAPEGSSDSALLTAVLESHLQPLRPFIVCFCEDGDNLGQWRGYGLTGGGYALGFEKPRLPSGHSADPDGWDLLRVIYEVDEQQALLGKALDSHLQMFQRRLHQAPKEQIARLTAVCAKAFAILCVLFAARIKHPTFRSEHEWRLLSHDEEADVEKTLFRSRASHLVPYRIVQYAKNEFPLREIVVGPTTHEEVAEDAVKQLLAHCGLQNVAVRRSEVPLRL